MAPLSWKVRLSKKGQVFRPGGRRRRKAGSIAFLVVMSNIGLGTSQFPGPAGTSMHDGKRRGREERLAIPKKGLKKGAVHGACLIQNPAFLNMYL